MHGVLATIRARVLPVRRRMALVLAVLALLASASGMAAAPAGAAVVRGPAWPHGVITYHVMVPTGLRPVARASCGSVDAQRSRSPSCCSPDRACHEGS